MSNWDRLWSDFATYSIGRRSSPEWLGSILELRALCIRLRLGRRILGMRRRYYCAVCLARRLIIVVIAVRWIVILGWIGASVVRTVLIISISIPSSCCLRDHLDAGYRAKAYRRLGLRIVEALRVCQKLLLSNSRHVRVKSGVTCKS